MRGVFRVAVIVIAICSMVPYAYAQSVRHPSDTTRHVMQQSVKPKPKGPKAIKHELSAGFRLNTNGWSGYMDFGSVKAKNLKTADMFYNVRLFQVEFTEKKSPKQEKTVVDGNASGNSGSYIYGKINNFYALKLGYGFSKMLAGKPDPGSVSIHWVNVIGFSLGMLKPYYLNTLSDPNAIRYTEATKSDFLTQGLIVGSAGFGKGLSEISFIPGGHFKSALHFDFSANRKDIIGAEVGINAEYYSADVPIMANQPAQSYFVDLFLAVQFGRRW